MIASVEIAIGSEVPAGQGLVDGREIEAVLPLRNCPRNGFVEGVAGDPLRRQDRLEIGEGTQCSLRMGLEQPAVVGGSELLGDQRPDVAAEVHRSSRRGQRTDRSDGEVLRWDRHVAGHRVAQFRVVGHPAAGPDVQDGFGAARGVRQGAVPVGGEAAAPSLTQQNHQIDERQTETPDQDRFSGLQVGEIEIGGVAGWDVGQTPGRRGGRQARLLGRRVPVKETLGQHDDVADQHGPVGEGDPLPVVDVHHLHRGGNMRHDPDPVR